MGNNCIVSIIQMEKCIKKLYYVRMLERTSKIKIVSNNRFLQQTFSQIIFLHNYQLKLYPRLHRLCDTFVPNYDKSPCHS